MKNIKKMLACVLSVVTLGACISTIPTSADVVLNDVTYTEVETNMTTTNYGIVTPYMLGTYTLPDDFTVQNIFDDENVTLIIDGKSFKLDSVRLSLKSTEQSSIYYEYGQFYEENLDKNDLISFNCTFIDDNNNYWNYTEYVNDEKAEKTLQEIPLIGSAYNPTIGESSEPSEETLKRGDINGDGNINVLDLLQLKKYILKIIDTLD